MGRRTIGWRCFEKFQVLKVWNNLKTFWKGWCQPTSEASSLLGGKVLWQTVAGGNSILAICPKSECTLCSVHTAMHRGWLFILSTWWWRSRSKPMFFDVFFLFRMRQGVAKSGDSDQGAALQWGEKIPLMNWEFNVRRNYLLTVYNVYVWNIWWICGIFRAINVKIFIPNQPLPF